MRRSLAKRGVARRGAFGLGFGAVLGLVASGCGTPTLDLDSEAGAAAARKRTTDSILLGSDALRREIGSQNIDDYSIEELPPGMVVAEAKASTMSIVQAVTVFKTAAEAAKQFEAIANGQAAAEEERKEIQTPGPAGSRAFAILFAYWNPAVPSPAVIVLSHKKNYVARVEVYGRTHDVASTTAGRVTTTLLNRM